MNPQVLNSQVTAAFPSSEMPPPNDLMCFDPQNDVHILTLGATSMFIAAFLGFFFVNCCRANSMNNMQSKFDRDRAAASHRHYELKREVSHLRRDLFTLQFQETESQISRVLQRTQSPSSPLFHSKDWEKEGSLEPIPTAPPLQCSGSGTSGSPSRGQTRHVTVVEIPCAADGPDTETMPHIITEALTYHIDEPQREFIRMSRSVDAYPFTDQPDGSQAGSDGDDDPPRAASLIAPAGGSLIAP